jgi:geranylgeranyl reductase family protein
MAEQHTITTTAVIIGAGPAGCSTSTYLSKAGIAHVIIDKAVFPRDKVCGDAVSGTSVYVIRNASEAWLEELRTSHPEVLQSSGLSFVAPNGASLPISFGKGKDGHSPGFTIPRLYFDDFLFKKLEPANATILSGATAEQIVRTEDGWTIAVTNNKGKYTICTKVLVAADGDKSIVRKHLGLNEASPKTSAVGLRAYYSGIKGLNNDGLIELHFLNELLPGYLWIFPLTGGRANVGVGMLSKDVRDKKINLRERMLHAIETNPGIRDRFKDAKLDGKILGWGLPMGMERSPLSGDGFILTGDAAHLIDPFSGEGIGNALYSGMRAAGAIEAALKASDFSGAFLKAAYDDPLYKRLWGELRTSAVLQRLCRYPSLFNFVINKANRTPTLKSTISGMFTHLDLRSKLRKPSFYLKMLLNR